MRKVKVLVLPVAMASPMRRLYCNVLWQRRKAEGPAGLLDVLSRERITAHGVGRPLLRACAKGGSTSDKGTRGRLLMQAKYAASRHDIADVSAGAEGAEFAARQGGATGKNRTCD